MNTEKLLDAIGMLPNDLLAETDHLRNGPRKIPFRWRRWTALAACLVLVIAAGMFCLRTGLLSGISGGAKEAAPEAPREMAPAAMDTMTDNSITQDAPAAEAAPKAESEEEPVPDTHPLPLTLSWEGGEITAKAAGFTLREILEDGSVSETIACGAHPLQANPEPTAIDAETVALDWAISPDRITVRCWSRDADISEDGYTFSILGVRNNMPVLPDYQIYEITAVWEDTCTASYVVRLDLEMP